jgi:hypothetical protein
MSYNHVNTVTLVSIYSQKAVKMIDAFERKILRQISGPTQAAGWKKLNVRKYGTFNIFTPEETTVGWPHRKDG